MRKLIKKNKKPITTLAVIVLSGVLLSACALSPKPAPSWPSGQEHPINKVPASSKDVK